MNVLQRIAFLIFQHSLGRNHAAQCPTDHASLLQNTKASPVRNHALLQQDDAQTLPCSQGKRIQELKAKVQKQQGKLKKYKNTGQNDKRDDEQASIIKLQDKIDADMALCSAEMADKEKADKEKADKEKAEKEKAEKEKAAEEKAAEEKAAKCKAAKENAQPLPCEAKVKQLQEKLKKQEGKLQKYKKTGQKKKEDRIQASITRFSAKTDETNAACNAELDEKAALCNAPGCYQFTQWDGGVKTHSNTCAMTIARGNKGYAVQDTVADCQELCKPKENSEFPGQDLKGTFDVVGLYGGACYCGHATNLKIRDHYTGYCPKLGKEASSDPFVKQSGLWQCGGDDYGGGIRQQTLKHPDGSTQTSQYGVIAIHELPQ